MSPLCSVLITVVASTMSPKPVEPAHNEDLTVLQLTGNTVRVCLPSQVILQLQFYSRQCT